MPPRKLTAKPTPTLETLTQATAAQKKRILTACAKLNLNPGRVMDFSENNHTITLIMQDFKKFTYES